MDDEIRSHIKETNDEFGIQIVNRKERFLRGLRNPITQDYLAASVGRA
jgi:hypothetical protein